MEGHGFFNRQNRDHGDDHSIGATTFTGVFLTKGAERQSVDAILGLRTGKMGN